MKLIRTVQENEALIQALADLDIIRLLMKAEPSWDDKKAAQWAACHFEENPEELKARYALLEDIQDLSVVEKAYDLVLKLKDELQKQELSPDVLREVIYQRRSFSVFIELIETLCTLSEGADASDRLKNLKALVQGIQQDPSFAAIQSVTAEVLRILPPAVYMHVAVNTRENGEALEIGILRDEQTERKHEALIDSHAPEGISDSLFSDMRYTRGQYGTHFEEYLVQQYEKHYHNEVGKAHKLLKNVRVPKTDELLELEESLEFLSVALKMKQLFTEAGYTVTLPDPTGQQLEASNLMYPDLALHLDHLEGKQVVLPCGSSTLITGANHSGKTSYLKTLGQSLVMAQFGFYVPADTFAFHPFHAVYTLFATGEDSSMSVSRMGVEIQRLSLIMTQATEKDFVLINEPMTSTNPLEAVSICSDLMIKFIDHHITHLVVTHLYDIYYLLQAQMSEEQKTHFTSMVTLSEYAAGKGMIHSFRLKVSPPLGNSYAVETAKQYKITLEDLIEDPLQQEKAARYCRKATSVNIYEGGEADGISDNHG